jgi:hypothetical protein
VALPTLLYQSRKWCTRPVQRIMLMLREIFAPSLAAAAQFST